MIDNNRRDKEREAFLTEHLEQEVVLAIGAYLTNMQEIDKRRAAAHLMALLVNVSANSIAFFSKDIIMWKRFIKQFQLDLEEYEDLVKTNGERYFYFDSEVNND